MDMHNIRLLFFYNLCYFFIVFKRPQHSACHGYFSKNPCLVKFIVYNRIPYYRYTIIFQ